MRLGDARVPVQSDLGGLNHKRSHKREPAWTLDTGR